MGRSHGELMALEVEAERLVRCGESRAEVSRMLGVHPQTLATWALRGRWRKKDLDRERSAEIARETILAIRKGVHGARRANEQSAHVAAALRRAVELLADGSAEAMAELERMLGGIESPKLLPGPTVTLGPDKKMGKWRSLADANPNPEPIRTEDGEVWTPELQERIDRQTRAQAIARGGRSRRDADV